MAPEIMPGMVLSRTATAMMFALASLLGQGRAQIIATVIANDNWPVSGVVAAEVVLRDGGVRQQVLAVDPATDPMAVAIVLSGFSADAAADLGQALDTFATAMRAGGAAHRVVLMAEGPDSSAVMTPLAFDARDITAAITRTLQHSRPLTEQMAAATAWLSTVPEERRAIVGIIRHGAAAVKWPDTATTSLIDARSCFWTIEIDKPGDAALNRALDDVTNRTGAMRLKAASVSLMNQEARHAAALLRSQYVVTFAWPDPSLSTFSMTTRHDGGAVLTPAWFR
jgi:hypothetical protein